MGSYIIQILLKNWLQGFTLSLCCYHCYSVMLLKQLLLWYKSTTSIPPSRVWIKQWLNQCFDTQLVFLWPSIPIWTKPDMKIKVPQSPVFYSKQKFWNKFWWKYYLLAIVEMQAEYPKKYIYLYCTISNLEEERWRDHADIVFGNLRQTPITVLPIRSVPYHWRLSWYRNFLQK